MFEYDSQEELYFSWALKELTDKGVILEWFYHPKPFVLSERIVHVFEKQLKTKSIIKDSVILNDHIYQADFHIRWNKEWSGKVYMSLIDKYYHKASVFVANGEKHFSVIDVKGSFAGPHNTSAVTFPLNQKWVYQKYGIYVQKIIPDQLFRQSFTPMKYLLTDKSGRSRKIKYETRTITQYLDSIKE